MSAIERAYDDEIAALELWIARLRAAKAAHAAITSGAAGVTVTVNDDPIVRLEPDSSGILEHLAGGAGYVPRQLERSDLDTAVAAIAGDVEPSGSDSGDSIEAPDPEPEPEPEPEPADPEPDEAERAAGRAEDLQEGLETPTPGSRASGERRRAQIAAWLTEHPGAHRTGTIARDLGIPSTAMRDYMIRLERERKAYRTGRGAGTRWAAAQIPRADTTPATAPDGSPATPEPIEPEPERPTSGCICAEPSDRPGRHHAESCPLWRWEAPEPPARAPRRPAGFPEINTAELLEPERSIVEWLVHVNARKGASRPRTTHEVAAGVGISKETAGATCSRSSLIEVVRTPGVGDVPPAPAWRLVA